jgi:hypothetical protein
MRRPNGHVRERSPGSWELRYSLGTDPATGKRRVVTTSIKGKREAAEKELRRRLHTLDTGEHLARNRALGDIAKITRALRRNRAKFSGASPR